MKWISHTALVLAAFIGLSVGPKVMALPTVEHVELTSYLGLWYEVFRLPNDFQDDTKKEGFGACFNTTAEYGQMEDGRISVLNTCNRSNGQKVIAEQATGKARVVDEETNAKLKVNFTGNPILERLGIGDGDYWILHLGQINDEGLYSYSLVGVPALDHLWFLSRIPSPDQATVSEALAKARTLGFDTSKVKFSREMN